MSRIIPILIIVAAFLIATMAFLGVFGTIKSIVESCVESIVSALKTRRENRRISRRLNRVIENNKYDFSIHLLFETFCHFYETNFEREKVWELDKSSFPNGLSDLTEKYLWIKSIRDYNLALVESTIFDLKSGKTLYLNHLYPDFRFQFDRAGRLEIVPSSEGEPAGFLGYRLKMSRIHTAMNTMDNDVCMWILTNRKYFAF